MFVFYLPKFMNIDTGKILELIEGGVFFETQCRSFQVLWTVFVWWFVD